VDSPIYLPLAEHLPAVYREDAESFRQVESYLGLVDELQRAYVARLDELSTWLSPDALSQWPADRSLDAGEDAVLARYHGLFDELAGWFGFVFPLSWGHDAASLEQRRSFLVRAARLWRRRGTPRGFIDWFSFWFDLDLPDRPFLVEHFKFGQPTSSDGDVGPDPGLRATLFVPSTERFPNTDRRTEGKRFVDAFAPAHVHVRVCWIRPARADPADPPGPYEQLADAPAAGAPDAELEAYRSAVNELLCSLVSVVEHADGIRIWECIDEGRAIDRLDVGRLPHAG
jgi:hypothetical protein